MDMWWQVSSIQFIVCVELSSVLFSLFFLFFNQGWTSYHAGPRLHSFHGPCLLPFLPFLPSSPLPFPFPPSSSLFPLPSLPLEVDPLNTARGLRECCKLPQWGLGRPEPQLKWTLVHFSPKIWHLVAPVIPENELTTGMHFSYSDSVMKKTKTL